MPTLSQKNAARSQHRLNIATRMGRTLGLHRANVSTASIRDAGHSNALHPTQWRRRRMRNAMASASRRANR